MSLPNNTTPMADTPFSETFEGFDIITFHDPWQKPGSSYFLTAESADGRFRYHPGFSDGYVTIRTSGYSQTVCMQYPEDCPKDLLAEGIAFTDAVDRLQRARREAELEAKYAEWRRSEYEECKKRYDVGKLLPKAEIERLSAEWKLTMNEGGDGYNPYDGMMTLEYYEYLRETVEGGGL